VQQVSYEPLIMSIMLIYYYAHNELLHWVL